MKLPIIAICTSLLGTVAGVALGPAAAPTVADLEPHTLQAFQRYAAVTEARVLEQVKPEGPFLYLDYLPQQDSERILADLRRGELFMEPLETRDASGGEIKIKDGLVHHWLGAVFIPGVGLETTLELIQDYDRHSEIYGPDVAAAHVISRNGGDFEVFMRFHKHKIITVVMDTVHDVQYVNLAADRTYSISRTTSVREVKSPDTAEERALADGEGGGFLWRINSYWRFLERDGGTYVETESISLTRTIPFLLRWLVGPFVNDMPREQLADLLESTREALANGGG